MEYLGNMIKNIKRLSKHFYEHYARDALKTNLDVVLNEKWR